jgi:hypothetical protein
LIGEEQLRLADARRLDALVADKVMADQQLSKRLVRKLAGCVGVHRSGDANRFTRSECRRIEARGTERRKQQFARCVNQRLPLDYTVKIVVNF